MCVLIGYRRGPGGQRRQAASQTRSRSSGGFVQNVIGCMNITFLSAGSRPACRDGQSSSSAAAPYICRPGWHSSNPQSRGVGLAWPPHKAAGLGMAALVSSVGARLKPGHTRNMALGCSTTTPTGTPAPPPEPRMAPTKSTTTFRFFGEITTGSRETACCSIFDQQGITTERRQFLLASDFT